MRKTTHFKLFVDAEIKLRYTFSNGTVIMTEPDFEYRHRIDTLFTGDVQCDKIEQYDDDQKRWFTIEGDYFTATGAGWMEEVKLSKAGLLQGKLLTILF